MLFIKIYVERCLTRRKKKNRFGVEVLRDRLDDDPLNNLFQSMKRVYVADRIFDEDERTNLKPAT